MLRLKPFWFQTDGEDQDGDPQRFGDQDGDPQRYQEQARGGTEQKCRLWNPGCTWKESRPKVFIFCVFLPFFYRLTALFSKSFCRYSVAFTSALASSEDKVSKKEKHSHKTDRGEPAPKEAKKNPEERNSHNHDGTSNQKTKGIKNESDKQMRQIEACSR